MPEPSESHLLAEAWAEVLDGEIPENRLEAAYLRAMKDKQGGYALTSSDMVKAFRDNCESERSAPRIAQDTNLLPGQVCKKCFGSGWEQFTENGYKQVRKCNHLVEGFIGPPDPDSDVDLW